jgi:FHS family glucose/mannose:H+ symporter-like MFS transporter
MFVLTGVTNTLLGPLLPVLVEWWTLPDARAGLLFTFQFVGSMAGAALSSPIIRVIGLRRTLLGGVVIMGTGVGALAFREVALGHAAVWWYGAGLGLTIPATNLWVAQHVPGARAAALSLLNLSWGIGAIAGPPAVVLSRRIHDANLFLFALAASLLLSAFVIGLMREPTRTEGAAIDEGSTRVPVNLRGRVIAFGVFLFVYVGTETSVSGWAAIYAQRVELLAAATSIAAPSIFWGALLAGRALAPALLLRWTEPTLLTTGLLVTTAAVVALLFAGSGATLTAAMILAGFGLSVVFPVSFALFTKELDRAATRAAGPVFVLAGLGGASLPWLVGVVSARTQNLRAGLMVPLAGCVAMLLLNAQRRSRRKPL